MKRFLLAIILAIFPATIFGQEINKAITSLQHQIDSLEARRDSLRQIQKMQQKVANLQNEISILESGETPQYAKPGANVRGRNIIGQMPRLAYTVQESGIVVVSVWVDNYGNVTKALAGADGTTISNKTLWQSARNAAMNTHFNQRMDAPALEEGTITYVFNAK